MTEAVAFELIVVNVQASGHIMLSDPTNYLLLLRKIDLLKCILLFPKDYQSMESAMAALLHAHFVELCLRIQI